MMTAHATAATKPTPRHRRPSDAERILLPLGEIRRRLGLCSASFETLIRDKATDFPHVFRLGGKRTRYTLKTDFERWLQVQIERGGLVVHEHSAQVFTAGAASAAARRARAAAQPAPAKPSAPSKPQPAPKPGRPTRPAAASVDVQQRVRAAVAAKRSAP